jgi:hypothetical protein
MNMTISNMALLVLAVAVESRANNFLPKYLQSFALSMDYVDE